MRSKSLRIKAWSYAMAFSTIFKNAGVSRQWFAYADSGRIQFGGFGVNVRCEYTPRNAMQKIACEPHSDWTM